MTVETIETGEEEDVEGDYGPEDEDQEGHEEEYRDDGEGYEGRTGKWLARSCKNKPKRQLSRPLRVGGHRQRLPSAAIIRMRHQASGVLFVWRTAGVKDTCGAELQEGDVYRLVASVRDAPDMAVKEVAVTRCRLSLVTDI